MDIVMEDTVCRLCMKTPLTEFVLIGETVKEMLDVLLVKTDFDASIKPLMCEDCAGIVKRLISFKSVCLDTEEMLVDGVLFHSDDDIANVCRFCMETVREEQFIPLDVLLKSYTFSDMMKKYMFHVDLNILENPPICWNCRDNMETYFKFLHNCRDTEEKINTYQRNNRENGLYPKNAKEGFCETLREIKEEFDTENEGVMDPLLCRSEKIDDHEASICDVKDSGHCFKCYAMLKETAPSAEDIKEEIVQSEVNNLELKIETEELIIKDEVDSEKRKLEDKSKEMIFECDSCEYQTKYKGNLTKHILVHRDPSEVQTYQCANCKYKTKHKTYLKRHMLVHKDSSEVQMYQMYWCDSCEYQTNRKEYLKKHMLVHKDSSEVQMYHCDSCDFETKYLCSLKKHLLVHKDPSDLQMYQCDSCDFKAKRLDNLKSHALVHKDSSDMQMLRCDSCEYQTNRKEYLHRHMLVHKDSSEVQMYYCNICVFQTKYRRNLSYHLLTHKNSSEVQVFQCDSCEYQTNRKGNLKKHSLIHKASTNVQMYQCDTAVSLSQSTTSTNTF